MDDPAKYIIRATVTASGVVERNDVVGAVFGQTEGLLGNELDLRALQENGRVGRIDVDIQSAGGRSVGDLAIATDLDRAETAVLAAALETIERIGPARASVQVDRIEDVRAAKRREIVDRARELLAGGFEDVGLEGRDLVAAVREAVAPAEVITYANLPAGPGITTDEEIIVVEGRADVLRLLEFGITNVIGVEGTDVSDDIAQLTHERTTTAFFDGDRGGDLLLLELAQIGDIDFVTFAPQGRSVEDLTMAEVYDALARKVPYESDAEPELGVANSESISPKQSTAFLDHIADVIESESGRVRLLGPDWQQAASAEIGDVESLFESAENEIRAAIIDDVVDQQLIDMATRGGIPLVIARERGEFVKRPTDVRVLTAEEVRSRDIETEELSI